MISAPAPPRLLPKSPLGVSVWTAVLLDNYRSGRPTHRLCEVFQHHGLPLAQGTLTDGRRRLVPLFEPVGRALPVQQLSEPLCQGDETRWEVFEEVEGKVGHRWYRWVIRSASVVFYPMAPSRGAETPTAHCAGLDPALAEVVLVCDRYSAYQCLANGHEVLILAFCWVQVRRDFIDAARGWPELTAWLFDGVEDIRELYRLKAARLEVWDNTRAFAQQPLVFVAHQRALTAYLERLQGRCEACLQAEDLQSAKRKVLTSWRNPWAGLTVFVTRPAVAMDKNSAERALRPPVIGRKNYYGSGSVWGAHLAAAMFSVRQTVLLWGLNPHQWLSAFLPACADHGGQPPVDLAAFLPGAMTDARKQPLAPPLPVKYPGFGTSSPGIAPEPADTS
jgi:transposase